MGYESKLFIVQKSTFAGCAKDRSKFFAQIVAAYDLCAFPPICEVFTTPTNCYIYAEDGNTETLIDKYGQPLTEASAESVINCLENLSAQDAEYRRVAPLLAMLKAFQSDIDKWDSLAVLHYGH